MAAPTYVAGERQAIAAAPPGHRFLLYFQSCTGGDRWQPLKKEEKRSALEAVAGMGETATGLLRAIDARRRSLVAGDVIAVEYETTAPLATGLGNPHPVENGFAFLSPYGVPYLPGSSIKGVVRRAAEELSLFYDDSDWTVPLVWVLFGFEEGSAYLTPVLGGDGAPPALREEAAEWRQAFDRWAAGPGASDATLRTWVEMIANQLPGSRAERSRLLEAPAELLQRLSGAGDEARRLRRRLHSRGLLSFLDAFPDHRARMEVDILSPHHRNYYEGNGSPHDAENPTPVYFLVLAPGATFRFTVAASERAAGLVGADWRALVGAAFEHAAEWLGFGAKTAVGYGALCTPDDEPEPKAFDESHRPASAFARTEETWEGAVLAWDAGGGRLTATRGSAMKTAPLTGDAAQEFLGRLPDALRARLRKRKKLEGVTVVVNVLGNQITLKRPV